MFKNSNPKKIVHLENLVLYIRYTKEHFKFAENVHRSSGITFVLYTVYFVSFCSASRGGLVGLDQ